MGERARPQAARPALRPADRRDAGVRAARHPRGRVARLQEPRRLQRQAGARDLAGNTILSNEAGATAGGAYSTTWETELRKLAPEFAAGVNQNVFHGFSYATTPESRWPGFSAFSPLNNVAGYGESWGPRQPTWKHASDISGYFARNQEVMQTGRNIVDVGVLVQTGYVAAGYGAPYFTADTREAAQVLKDGGNHVGWTNERISESILDLPERDRARQAPRARRPELQGARARGRRRLQPRHPAARRDRPEAARLGQGRAADRDRRQLDRRRRVRGLAKAGENAHAEGPGRRSCSRSRPSATPPTATCIPAALADLGVQRDVEYPVAPLRDRPPRRRQHRLLLLANSHATAAASVDATFAMTDPTAVPYVADAWTGKLVPVANYTRQRRPPEDADRAQGRPDDDPRLRPRPRRAAACTRRAPPPTPCAPTARTSSPAPRRPAPTPRRWRTAAPCRPRSRPSPRRCRSRSWTLDVDDWLPGRDARRRPLHAPHTLHARRPEGVVGHPRAGRRLRHRHATRRRSSGTARGGAYLDLGEVFDTYRVTINGARSRPPTSSYTTVDVGPYLKSRARTRSRSRSPRRCINRLRAGDVALRERHAPELRPDRPGQARRRTARRAVYAQTETPGGGRRHRARDALAHARRAGDASARSRRASTRTYDGLDHRQRDLHRGRRGADGVGPRPPDQRRVHAAASRCR